MIKRSKDKQNQGFSLVETLAVVAILVILLSLSAVAAAYYRDYLKITELDNAAREIYMAAENRAVLLDSGGQLDSTLGVTTLSEGGTPAQPIHITKEAAADNGLLTTGAIDPALLNGDFYIFYDPASGGVTDVFYAEKHINYMGMAPDDPTSFLNTWSKKSRDERMRPGDAGPMLGYYGGEQAEREDYTPLPAPEVMVVVDNGDLLRVHVTFSVPESALSLVGNWVYDAKQAVTLQYGGETVTLMDRPSSFPPKEVVRNPSTMVQQGSASVTYTWILDALDTPALSGRHFWQLFNSDDPQKAPICGGDFTVTANIELSAPGRRPTSASGSDTGNSLFAEGSGGSTARLENLRHLQNLDHMTSNAGDKGSAVLLNDIDCCGQTAQEPYGLYEFKPIVNEELHSFDGGWTAGTGEKRRNEITNLKVRMTADGASERHGAGLFAKTAEGMSFSGVRLLNADVSAENVPAGVLVGSAGSGSSFRDIRVVNSKAVCTNSPAGGVAGKVAGASGKENSFTDCQVYWEPEEGQENLRSLLGSDQENNLYKYGKIIHGTNAGGLVGELSGSSAGTTTIKNSLAATLVSGAIAGGMVGDDQHVLNVSGSYADCYIKGSTYAAGLVGKSKAGGTTAGASFKNVYTAGFIDVKGMSSGASIGGVVNVTGTVAGTNVYSAASYLNWGYWETSNSSYTYFGGIPENGTLSSNCYYLIPREGSDGDQTQPGCMTFDDMAEKDFASTMGSAFEFKGYRTTGSDSQNTYPYNLQEKQNLTSYSFPGLKGLPHYGDWQAYFKEPSLVYYEQYNTFDTVTKEDGTVITLLSRRFSGGNARTLKVGQLKEGEDAVIDYPTIQTDGYAVALLQSDLTGDSFTVTYTYPGVAGGEKVTYVTGTPGANQVQLLGATWTRQEAGKDKTDLYWLAPLPDKLVALRESSPDFYQYLKFEMVLNSGGGEGEKEKTASGEYFYNPHFAETVKPYVPGENGKPLVDWTAPGAAPEVIQNYITQVLTAGTAPVSVSVRTPRHLFHLSRHVDYYHSGRLVFQQHWPLDGGKGVYTGYPGLLSHDDRGFQEQSPIGTQAASFLGTYNGNFLPIRRVAFQIPENEKNRICAGLFGYSSGTLENIVYSLNPTPGDPASQDKELTPRPILFHNKEKDTYLGALAGLNALTGKIINCAVDSVSLTSRVYTSRIYVGGLCGKNEGTIQRSAAECAYLHVDTSNYGYAYVGGLTGYNSGQIQTAYAVGRLSAEALQENAHAYLGGFVSLNSGSVSNSYCAMDLVTDGANAAAYGFCASSSGGWQSGTFHLNDGNFSYRGKAFLAKYEDGGSAQPISYIDLTVEEPPVPGMASLGSTDPELLFPYPAAVSNGSAHLHYGSWPKPLKLGNMGVYYWEELQAPGKKPSYQVSLLAVDPGENKDSLKTITRLFALSTTHDEHGEVTRFGYGYYNKPGITVQLQDTPCPLLYSDGGLKGEAFDDKLAGKLAKEKETATDPSSPAYLNWQVDEELAQQMYYRRGELFEFHSFHTYDTDGAQGGLYPNSTPAQPNGTLTLYQGGDQSVSVTFALNPLFADTMAVELPDGKWSAEDVPLFTSSQNKDKTWTLSGDTPGSSKDVPYGVRSIDQLQFINWNSQHRNTTTVLAQSEQGSTIDTVDHFPYLSNSAGTGKYFWTQSYDLLGKKDTTYTPIAEYYDWNGGDQGDLRGWFGGTYNGGSYKIENVNIEGQVASCAGLFGVIYDGSLKDVVLYSSDGTGTITTKANGPDEGPKTQSRWYSMGALAGVAGTSDPEANAIKNCSVAGYTVLATTYTASGWGGNNIGGLVGASHMNLSGCSAVTKVIVRDATENDNMRVGGLAGICLGTVSNCYAGGSISIESVSLLSQKERGIYIGGLVGGSYMKPLVVANSGGKTIGIKESGTTENTNNTIQNCYSYVTLPLLTAHEKIKSLYVIGGTGEINPLDTPEKEVLDNHGICTMTNCYYLTSESLANFGGSEETYLTAIRGRGAKTDLDTSGVTVQDPDLELGEHPISGGFNGINTKNFQNAETGDTRYLDQPYYHESPTLGPGVGLFNYTGRVHSDGNWIYEFIGWLVDTSGSTWTYTTDPNYFVAGGGVTGLTYEQLAGMEKNIPGKDPALDIYDLLTDFQPVTTTEDGVSVPGKYSYATGIRPDLRDRDYPFPTVLTQDEKRVHYGDWPLKGFRRQTLFDENSKFELLGGSPIDIDLFVNGTELHQEYLVLTDGVKTGGHWNATIWESMAGAGGDSHVGLIADWTVSTVDAEDIPYFPGSEAGKSYYLFELTPKTDGTDTLHLVYTDPNGLDYSLDVTVHITAFAELRPNRLFMFPSDTVDISVKATDKTGWPLDDRVENGGLTLKDAPNCGSSGYLTAKTLLASAEDGKEPSIQFTTAVPEEALANYSALGANVSFTYTVSKPNPGDPDQPTVQKYESSDDILIHVIQPWADPPAFQVQTKDDGTPKVVCTLSFPNSYAFGTEGTLQFRKAGEPAVASMPKRPEAALTEADGTITLTLTYPESVQTMDDLPEEAALVSFPLLMTSGESELIDGEQRHTLTLTVKKPAAESSSLNLPEPQIIEALPPAEEGQENPARRRSWKRKLRRRCSAEHKF